MSRESDLAALISKYGSENVQMVLDVAKYYGMHKYDDNRILIKYEDNEYGEAAREFGLIKHSYDGDAGIDLPTVLSLEERKHGKATIYPGDRIMLKTGMRMAFPTGYWGRIIHRSSTEKNSRLRVIEGVIDQYRGPILVQVHNMNSYPIDIEHGQRIAQLILAKTASFKAEITDELPPSERGASGFGSSGKTERISSK